MFNTSSALKKPKIEVYAQHIEDQNQNVNAFQLNVETNTQNSGL